MKIIFSSAVMLKYLTWYAKKAFLLRKNEGSFVVTLVDSKFHLDRRGEGVEFESTEKKDIEYECLYTFHQIDRIRALLSVIPEQPIVVKMDRVIEISGILI